VPSPFPGMDPYIESTGRWNDFHERMLTHFCELLLELVPDSYDVSVEERVTSISVPGGDTKRAVIDIGITSSRAEDVDSSGGVATLEGGGVRLAHLDFEPRREAYLEITHKPDDRLVTVIELLSPANKEKPGSDLYREKREALLVQYVHIVEIDLLMRGTRLAMKQPLPLGDYFVYSTRAEDRAFAEVIGCSLRHQLPTIAIPLAEPDPELRVNLQALFNVTYDRGKYQRRPKYSESPPSFLRREDQEWARGIVAKPA